jgi:acetoin utilization protein AcuB
MVVSSIMTKKVITIDMDTQLLTICNIFKQKKFHHLLVMENNELLGVISDRDVLKALSPFIGTLAEQNRDLFTLKKKAHQIMSRKPLTISKETNMEEAASLMIRNNISCLPVISFDGQIEGIVTWKDLVKVYAQLIKIG